MPENTQQNNPIQPQVPIMPVSPSKPKTITIILIVVAGVGLLAIVGVVLAFTALKKVDNAVKNISYTDPVTGSKVEAESKNNDYTFKTDQGSITGKNNELPTDLPKEIPIYPGSTVDSSVTTKDNSGKVAGYVISLKSSDTYDKVSAYYLKELKGNGWDSSPLSANVDETTTIVSNYAAKNISIMMTVSKNKTTNIIEISIIAEYNNDNLTKAPSVPTDFPSDAGTGE